MSIRRRGDKWLVTVELGRDGTGAVLLLVDCGAM